MDNAADKRVKRSINVIIFWATPVLVTTNYDLNNSWSWVMIPHPLDSHLLGNPVEILQLGLVQLPEAWSDKAAFKGLNLSLQQLVFWLQGSHLAEQIQETQTQIAKFRCQEMKMIMDDYFGVKKQVWHLRSDQMCVCVWLVLLPFQYTPPGGRWEPPSPASHWFESL